MAPHRGHVRPLSTKEVTVAANSEQSQVVTLVDEAGNQQDFTLLQVVQIHESAYALLAPGEEAGAEPGTVVILRVEENNLLSIEDEDEFNHVVAHLQGHAAH